MGSVPSGITDKTGRYSLRELVVAIFLVVTLASWIAEQFFQLHIPEFVFLTFVSAIEEIGQ